MQIFIRTFSNNTIVINIDPNQTINDVKNIISEKLNIPTKYFRLTYTSLNLNNERSIFDYNILSDSTLHMMTCNF